MGFSQLTLLFDNFKEEQNKPPALRIYACHLPSDSSDTFKSLVLERIANNPGKPECPYFVLLCPNTRYF